MIDTISLLSETSTDEENRIINRLEKPTQLESARGSAILGFVGNLSCKIWPGAAAVSGSLPKYYLKEPGIMGRTDTARAIEKLSDETGIDWGRGRIRRVDVAFDLSLRRPLVDYSTSLGRLKNARRLEQENGLLYKGRIMDIVLYDKKAEMGAGGRAGVYSRGETVARLELRLRRQVRKRLGLLEGRASELTEEITWVNLARLWKTTYFSIERRKTMVDAGVEINGSWKDIERSLAAVALTIPGLSESIDRELMTAKAENRLSPLQIARIRQGLKQLSRAESLKDPEPILELDRKVNQAARYAR